MYRGRMHACLDEVKELGSFLELEILCDANTEGKESERKDALDEIKAVMEEIQLSMEQSTTTSYLSMLMYRYNNEIDRIESGNRR